MSTRKTLLIFAIVPLLAACGGKDPLVIPTVDVENLKINLPDRPTYNTGLVRTDGQFDYLDIYELSDFHGAVSYEAHSSGDYIGLSRLAGYLKSKRTLNEGGTIVVSSGDMFQGSADSNLTRGYMVNYSMNYMGFDSMTLGNHEFDWSVDWIKKNANLDYKGVKIPYLCANLVEKSTGNLPSFVQKSTIINRGDYKIGIIGTIGEELDKSITSSLIEGYEFKAEKSIVEAEAQALRGQGCNAIIWTTHNGVDNIPIVSGVDAIFGGHAHENKEGAKSGVPAMATQNYGRGIAHIELKMDKVNKTVVSATGNVHVNPSTDPGATEVNDIKTIISQYDSSLKPIKEIKIATTEKELLVESTLGNICVEGMLEYAKKANSSLKLGVDEQSIGAVYHNTTGGIRSNIAAGDILYNDVYKSFPFDNEIVFIKVTGTKFKSLSVNSAITPLAIYNNVGTSSNIATDRDYYIATTDFLALSGNYFKNASVLPDLTEADLIHTGVVVRDAIAEKLYNEDKINSNNYTSDRDCFKKITRY